MCALQIMWKSYDISTIKVTSYKMIKLSICSCSAWMRTEVYHFICENLDWAVIQHPCVQCVQSEKTFVVLSMCVNNIMVVCHNTPPIIPTCSLAVWNSMAHQSIQRNICRCWIWLLLFAFISLICLFYTHFTPKMTALIRLGSQKVNIVIWVA